jgi:thymidylate synthase (FAD)
MNKQKVKLVALTNPVIADVRTGEDLVAYCGRVSNPSNQLNFDTAQKLIGYLKRNQHWSPFEMVNIVMEINTTRDIARQILRHRSFSFQEFSTRYADTRSLEQGFVTKEARLQDHKNRQNSLQEGVSEELHSWWDNAQSSLIQFVESVYKEALEKGIAKEVARVILPEGLTPTRLYINGTLRSWIHYCDLRRGNGTQKEHKEIAEECWNILVTQFPSITE